MDRQSHNRKSLLPMPSSSSTAKKARPSSSGYGFKSSSKAKMTPSCSRPSISRPSLLIKKDNRQLDNPSVRKKEVNNLYKTLLEFDFRNEKFSIERLNPPSNVLYQSMFTFLIQHMVKDYIPTVKKPEEQMLNILRDLGYPFPISKSNLSNVVPGSWPQTLGVLVWLSRLLKYLQDCGPKVEEILVNDPLLQVKHFLHRQSYEAFMDGDDGPYTAVEMQVQDKLNEINRDEKNSVEEKIRLLEQKRAIYQSNLEKKKKFETLVDRVRVSEEKQTKIEKYISEVQAYIASKEKNTAILEKEIVSMQDKIQELNKEISKIESTILHQKYSLSDMELKNMELKTLEEQEQEKIEKQKVIEEEIKRVKGELMKARKENGEEIRELNEKLRQVLSEDSGPSDINDLLLDAENPELNKTKLMEKIFPLITSVSERILNAKKSKANELRDVKLLQDKADQELTDLTERMRKERARKEDLEKKLAKENEDFEEAESLLAEKEADHKRYFAQLHEDQHDMPTSEQLQAELERLQQEIKRKQEQREREVDREMDELREMRRIAHEKIEKKKEELIQAHAECTARHEEVIASDVRKMKDLDKMEKQVDDINKDFLATKAAIKAELDKHDEETTQSILKLQQERIESLELSEKKAGG